MSSHTHHHQHGSHSQADQFVGRYRVIRQLHRGGQSEGTTLVQNAAGHLRVAKVVSEDQDDLAIYRLRVEIKTLKLARHGPNLNLYYEDWYDRRTNLRIIVLEYCDLGSLWDYIRNQKRLSRRPTEEFVWNALLSLSSALAFLHHGVRNAARDVPPERWNTTIHLDLQPRNVFLKTPSHNSDLPRVVLGDFGCSVRQSDRDAERETEHSVGTAQPGWLPPEQFLFERNERSYGRHTDIWQLAATTWTLGALKRWPSPIRLPRERPFGNHYSESLNVYVRSCAAVEPQFRPNAITVAVRGRAIARSQGFEIGYDL